MRRENPRRKPGPSRCRGFDRPAPVKVGDVRDVKIVGTSKRGDGVAKIEGFVVFVPGAREGESVRIRVVAVRPNYAISEVLSRA